MKYIIHTGPGIGDIIQFLSMARAIKENDPDARVDLLMRGSDKVFIEKLTKFLIIFS